MLVEMFHFRFEPTKTLSMIASTEVATEAEAIAWIRKKHKGLFGADVFFTVDGQLVCLHGDPEDGSWADGHGVCPSCTLLADGPKIIPFEPGDADCIVCHGRFVNATDEINYAGCMNGDCPKYDRGFADYVYR